MTPAIDLALKNNIEHTVHSYQHDPKAESYGGEAVELLGVDKNWVFKTLVIELNTGELAIGVVPVNGKLNLKAIANTLNVKKAVMADTQKAQRVTGYLLGGISPLGQKKTLKTVIDSRAESLSTVYVSAGRRGLEIELMPSDLATLCNATFASISSS